MAYTERANLAIDHVVGHLAEPLPLADIARAARRSPFHFHRVFQVLVGETLAVRQTIEARTGARHDGPRAAVLAHDDCAGVRVFVFV